MAVVKEYREDITHLFRSQGNRKACFESRRGLTISDISEVSLAANAGWI
jgi:hypothetical protein